MMFATVPARQRLTAIGQLRQLFGVSPQRIAEIAETHGIEAAVQLNGVPHFDAEGVERLREHIEGNVTGGGGVNR